MVDHLSYTARKAEVYGPQTEWTAGTLAAAIESAIYDKVIPREARVESTWGGHRDEDGVVRATITFAWEESRDGVGSARSG